MYCTEWATSPAHLLIPLKWNLILLSEQHIGSSLYLGFESYPGRFQPSYSPLGWGFLFLLGSGCQLRYLGFPGCLSSCFTSCNMPPFLLPWSGHLYYSPLESSSGWQRGMANRCSATHSLVCFGPLMHNQDQIDYIAWTGDRRLISRACSLQCKGRASQSGDVLAEVSQNLCCMLARKEDWQWRST